MNKYLFIIIQLIVYTNVFAQKQEQICFVKYKSLETESFLYNSWLLQDTVLYDIEYVFDRMFEGFPVYDQLGNSRTETDTVKYNKEYKWFLKTLRDGRKGYIQTHKRAYNSKTVNTYWTQPNVENKYIIVDTIANMENWNILNDTCTLLNFKCQKATISCNNVMYIAWFTTELPYNSGPEKFMGLPGLILKISNKEETLGFSAIEIRKPYKEKYLPYFESVEKKISFVEYERLAMAAFNEVIEASKNIKIGQ